MPSKAQYILAFDPDISVPEATLLSVDGELIASEFEEGGDHNSRWPLQYEEQFIKPRVAAIHMVGGGVKSDIRRQIHADVLDRPIRQMKDPIEVKERGAAPPACAALGHLRFAEICTHARIHQTYSPNPDPRKIFDELFKELVAVYQCNHKNHARLNRTH